MSLAQVERVHVFIVWLHRIVCSDFMTPLLCGQEQFRLITCLQGLICSLECMYLFFITIQQ